MHDQKQSKVKDQFLETIQSNFLDISIMEWMKLFGNHSDAHHWKKIAGDPLDGCGNLEQKSGKIRAIPGG
ncbi:MULTISPECIES: hypothetical protein [unclassified Legionella]|uniref:hypothetical protein n=1 Tax=unclassified Legionella TaxID=2622702 RepID=UPI0010564494|nr:MULTISPECIES: hypothetical protein [unclassified Legionella]MDI9819693.1 hypothetical protein [Legionella sp. PL877]